MTAMEFRTHVGINRVITATPSFTLTQPSSSNYIASSSFVGPKRVTERNQIRAEDLFSAILSSILPQQNGGAVLQLPLKVDNRGAIYIDEQDRSNIIQGLANPAESAILELILDIASECRRKTALMGHFLNHVDALLKNNPQQPPQYHLLLPLPFNELIGPLKRMLQPYLEKLTGIVNQKRSDLPSVKDFSDLSEFLLAQKKNLDAIFIPFGDLFTLSGNFQGKVHQFWATYLQSLNFWQSSVDVPEWKQQVFDEFVQLLCKYLVQRISHNHETFTKIDFIEQIWVDDTSIAEELTFAHRCIRLMPTQVKDDQLVPLIDIFHSCYKEAKDQNQMRFTQNFLVKLSNCSLAKFVYHLNRIIHNQSIINGPINRHFQQIKEFYSLNLSELQRFPIHRTCIIPFEEPNREEITTPKWINIEEEIRKQLKLDELPATADGWLVGNILHEKQHWSISILLDCHLYASLDRIFIRLYKFLHTWHRLISFWRSEESKITASSRMLMAANIKGRIQRNLLSQLAQMVQIFAQVLLSLFTSVNSFFLSEMAKELDGKDACLKKGINLVNYWREDLASLHETLSNSICAPLEELEKIVDELISTPSESTEAIELEQEEDVEVIKYTELMTRLRRVRLFMKNSDFSKLHNGRRNELMTPNGAPSPPVLNDALSLIKLLIPV